jgi:heme/copper-type cytochrome/quinol oxidase subunit 1
MSPLMEKYIASHADHGLGYNYEPDWLLVFLSLSAGIWVLLRLISGKQSADTFRKAFLWIAIPTVFIAFYRQYASGVPHLQTLEAAATAVFGLIFWAGFALFTPMGFVAACLIILAIHQSRVDKKKRASWARLDEWKASKPPTPPSNPPVD